MDIDIDFPTDFDPLVLFEEAVRASMVREGKLTKHPAGIYFQHIPVDCVTGFSAIPYENAEELGYTKIDFLHLSVLNFFDDKQQIRDLLEKEPNWGLLQSKTVVDKLFQLSKHYEVVNYIKPKSVEDLADCIAVIRPGKKHLLDSYDHNNKKQFRKKLYDKNDKNVYSYKKGHAISYALTVVLQLHLIQKGVL